MSDEKRKDHKDDERSEEFDRFEETLKKLVKAPKEEVDEKRKEWERERDDRKRAG